MKSPPAETRPLILFELGLVELNGNKKNNICLIESDLFSLSRVNDYLSVIYDPEDSNPQRLYKTAYIAHMPYEDIKGGMSAIGKPITMKKTIRRTIQFGTSNTGKTCAIPWASAQPATT